MPVNNMNVGVDYSIGYFDGTAGALIDLGDVQMIRLTALKHDIKSMPYNNYPRYGYVPDGFKLDFTITRTKALLEDLMVTFEANFQAGKVMSPGYINETINNPDNTISHYQYVNTVVFLTDHGDISREKVVTLKLEGYASFKRKI
jgi:hypothetical protein